MCIWCVEYFQEILMSKKVVRVRNYFSRRWFAAIMGSCFAFSMQSADAAPDGRPSFRDFRNDNPNVERNAARKMFNHQFRNNDGGANGALNDARAAQVIRSNDAVLRSMEKPMRVRFDQPRITNRSVQTFDNNIVNLHSGVNLDLSSADRNITLGEKLFDGIASVEINVGGQTKSVGAGSQVSAAEYVAVKQVLAGDGQQVTLDGSGRADGGTVDLGAITGSNDKMRASNLVVPTNVTTFGDFSRSSEFRLTGDLDNYGSVIAVASERGTRGGTIHADDITNHGLISTEASKNLRDATGARNGKLDLGLIADGDLTNFGTISASGSLTLSAGSGNIHNSGTVSSASGDVNLNGTADGVLDVNNNGGQIVAERGAISVRDASYAATFNTYVNGGDLLSKQLNTNAGNGVTYVSVNELTGEINQTGSAAHVEASTDVLEIGNICLTGDPTFRNTAGSINITADISVAEALTVVASGDIIVSTNADIAANNAAAGFDITLIAGADIVAAVGGADVTGLPPLVNNTTTLTISGNASSTGGAVVFNGNNTINTRSTAGVNTNGGNVLIAAFAGSDVGSGTVATSNASITTGGRGTGTNGDVLLIGGAENGTAVTLANVNTTGGNGGGGSIRAVTAQPVSDGGNIVYDVTGAKTSIASLTSSSTLTPTASLVVGTGTLTSGNTVNLRAGNILSIGSSASIIANNFGITLVSGGNTTLDGDLSSQGLTMTVGGNLNQGATSIATHAGNIFVNVTGTYNMNGVLSGAFGTAVIANSLIMGAGSAIGTSINDVTINTTGNIIGSLTSLVSADSGSVNLSSANGNIGANAGLKFRIDGDEVNATAFSGSIFIEDIDGVDITGATAFNRLDINAGDTMTISGFVSADVINLRSTADSVNMNFNISAGTSASLRASTDIVGSSTARLTAPQISLTAESADIGGGPMLPFRVDADNIVVNTTVGGAFISDNNSLNFGGGTSFVNSNLIALATGSISNTSPINSGGSVALASTSASVNVTAPISAADFVSLQSSNSITNANISATISAPRLGLFSTNGDIGVSAAAPFVTDVSAIGAGATAGSVFLRTTADSVSVSGLADAEFNIDASGSVVINDTNSIDAALVVINATGGITTNGTGQIIAPTLSITSEGDIGQDLANRLNLDVQNVSLLTTSDGIFVSNTSATAVTINVASSADTLAFDAVNADLVSTANFNQDSMFFETGGVFNFAGNLTATTALGLTSQLNLTNAQFTGNLSTNALLLRSETGNVGPTQGTPFVVTDEMANIIRVEAPVGTGFIDILNTEVIALAESSASGLEINATGPLTVIGNMTANGTDLNITTTTGELRLQSGFTLTGFNELNLINSGVNKKTDKIIIESGASILTIAKNPGQGDVNIVLGALSSKILSKVPKNVAVDEIGGDVEFRGKSLKAVGPVNTITAMGANVTISNSLNAKNLTLGGNVTITADPPVPVGTPRVTTIGGTANSGVLEAVLTAPTTTAPNPVQMPAISLIPVGDYKTNIGNQNGSLVFRTDLAAQASSAGNDSSIFWSTGKSKKVQTP